MAGCVASVVQQTTRRSSIFRAGGGIAARHLFAARAGRDYRYHPNTPLRRLALPFVLAGFAIAACGELLAKDPESDAEDAAIDAGSEQEALVDGGDADGTINYLRNGGFEDGCVLHFSVVNAAVTEMNAPGDVRSGTKACRVCKNNDSVNAAQFGQSIRDASTGEKYAASFWVRLPEDGGSRSRAEIAMQSGGGQAVPNALGWTEVKAAYEVEPGVSSFTTIFRFFDDDGGCMIIDDGSVTKL